MTIENLQFPCIEKLENAKKNLSKKLEEAYSLDIKAKPYVKICADVLNGYKAAIENFNKDVEDNIEYVDKIYKENFLGRDNRYLVEIKLYLERVKRCENKLFEKTEDKTWRIEKSEEFMYLFNCRYELEKGLKIKK